MSNSLDKRSVWLAGALIALAVAGCGSSKPTTSTSTGGGQSTTPRVSSQSARFGEPLALAGARSGEKMRVTVVRIVDPAQPSTQLTPLHGEKLIAVELRLENIGSLPYKDAPRPSTDAVDQSGRRLVGSGYPIVGCRDLEGLVNVAVGQTVTGCLAWSEPPSRSIAKVTFRLNAGIGPQQGIWTPR